jgi:hypothetical protein
MPGGRGEGLSNEIRGLSGLSNQNRGKAGLCRLTFSLFYRLKVALVNIHQINKNPFDKGFTIKPCQILRF